MEQSTNTRACAVARKRLPLFTYIYANKGLVSERAGPDIRAILQSLPEQKNIHTGAVVCAALFTEVSVEQAKVLQAKQDESTKANVVVLDHATQILHLQRVFSFKPVFTQKRPRYHRDADKWFQLSKVEQNKCNTRLDECMREENIHIESKYSSSPHRRHKSQSACLYTLCPHALRSCAHDVHMHVIECAHNVCMNSYHVHILFT